MVFRVLRRYWRSLTTLVLMASAVVWVVDGLDGRKAQVKPWEALVHELTRDAMAAESLQAPAGSLAEKSAHQTGVKSDAKPGTPQLIPDHEVGSDDGRIPGTFARRTIEVAQNAIHPGASKRLAATEDEQAEKQAKEATPANARRQQVRQEVEAAFAARQQGYEAEVRELRRRLQTIEERLETRSRLKQKIIDRRVEELLNPGVKWDENAPPATLSGAPLTSVDGRVTRVFQKRGDFIEVSISIGSKQGLKKEQKLVTFRPFTGQRPEGGFGAQVKLLGTLRLFDVQPDSAVAELLKPWGSSYPEIGDRVAEVLPPIVNPKSPPPAATTYAEAAAAPPITDYRWNLKQIGVAMHSYQKEHKHFPPPAIVDDRQNPLLSWRVALLPYLGEEKLYKEFHLNEPWNSKHNGELVFRMPDVFRRNSGLVPHGYTTFSGPLGKGTIFSQPKGTKFTDIADGMSNTIAVIDVRYDSAVPWTSPDRWTCDDKKPVNLLGELYLGSSVRVVVMCDGSVRELKPKVDGKTLMAAFTMNGGERFDLERELLEPARAIAAPMTTTKRSDNPVADREAFIRRVLSEKTSVQFVETPFRDALNFLGQQHEIPLIVDEPALTELGVNVNAQVNLQIEAITLNSVLNLILKPLKNVDFVVSDEVLKFTSREKAAKWRGTSAPILSPLALKNEEHIRKVLRSRTSTQFIETPLKDAVKFLQEQHGIPMLIDEAALTEEGINIETQINLQLSEISLRSVLNLMFEPLKITYVIEDEVLRIVPVKKSKGELEAEAVKSLSATDKIVPRPTADVVTPKPGSPTGNARRPEPNVERSPPETGERAGLQRDAGAFILRSPVEYGKVLGEAYMDAGWPQIKTDAAGKSLIDNSTSQRRYLITLLDEYRTQLQLLRVQVTLAEVNAQKVDIDYKRVANLHSHKVVADSDLALAKHALDTAQLRLQEIKTLLEVYRRIENDTLKAPTPRPDRMGSRTDSPKVETSKVMSPAEVEARRLRNLRKLGDAMLRYYADHQRFPPAAVLNTDDVPLLSWRVLLLPYLGEAKLFSEFRLNEPWDSAHNRPLAARMPDVYWALGTPREKGVTCLLAPVGKNTVFADPKGMSLADIPDGPETTALVLELPVFSDAVIWTKPQDKEIFGDGSTSFPFHQQNGAVWPILFCDGSVHSLQAPSWSNAASLVAAITRNGKERDDHNRRLGGLLGDVLPPRELPAHYPPEPMFVVDALPDGKIMVDGQLQSSAQLLKQLQTPGPSRLKPVVFLRGETSKGFEPTAKVLDVCREAGVATSVHLYRNRGIGIGPDLDFSKLSQLSGPGGLEERGDAVPLPPIRDSRALNLFKIVLAMVKYTSEHGLTNHGEAVRGKAFGVAFRNPSGQPLLSWRVALLPYLGEQELYQKFKLNEPWDSPHNGKLAQAMPDIYDFPGMLGPTDIRTAYVAVLSDNSLLGNSDLQKRTGIAPFMIHGGRDQAVIWTKPEDWKVDPQRPLAGLFSQRLNEIPAVFEDQSVRSISTRTLPDRVLSLSIGNDEKLFKDLEQNFGKSLLIQVGIAADGQLTLHKDQSWNSKKVITVVELQELLRAGARQEIRPAVLISFVGDSPRTRTALSIVRHFCRNLGIARLEERDSEPQPAKKGSTPPGKDSPKIEGEKSPAKAPHAAEKLLNASLEPVTGEALVPTLRKRYQGGLKITAVEADGLASRNGLRVGDVLVGLGDHATKSLADLEFVLEKTRAGQEVVLKFYSVRGAETFYGTLKLPKPSAGSNHPASPTQNPEKSGTDTKGARSDSSGAEKLPPAGLYAFDRKGYAWLRGTLGYAAPKKDWRNTYALKPQEGGTYWRGVECGQRPAARQGAFEIFQ